MFENYAFTLELFFILYSVNVENKIYMPEKSTTNQRALNAATTAAAKLHMRKSIPKEAALHNMHLALLNCRGKILRCPGNSHHVSVSLGTPQRHNK
jgi:hypothetical protein